jgi:hypothetical protein
MIKETIKDHNEDHMDTVDMKGSAKSMQMAQRIKYTTKNEQSIFATNEAF